MGSVTSSVPAVEAEDLPEEELMPPEDSAEEAADFEAETAPSVEAEQEEKQKMRRPSKPQDQLDSNGVPSTPHGLLTPQLDRHGVPSTPVGGDTSTPRLTADSVLAQAMALILNVCAADVDVTPPTSSATAVSVAPAAADVVAPMTPCVAAQLALGPMPGFATHKGVAPPE